MLKKNMLQINEYTWVNKKFLSAQAKYPVSVGFLETPSVILFLIYSQNNFRLFNSLFCIIQYRHSKHILYFNIQVNNEFCKKKKKKPQYRFSHSLKKEEKIMSREENKWLRQRPQGTQEQQTGCLRVPGVSSGTGREYWLVIRIQCIKRSIKEALHQNKTMCYTSRNCLVTRFGI